MNLETLGWLTCPDCSSIFKVAHQSTGSPGTITNGVASCDCRNYLVIEGILVFSRRPPLSRLTVDGLTKIGLPEALFFLSEPRDKQEVALCEAWLGSLVENLNSRNSLLTANLARLERVRKATSFFCAVDEWDIGEQGNFFKTRFAGATYITALPLLSLIGESTGPILDLGCGTGHHSAIISRLHPGRRLLCVDHSLTCLFLHRRFFSQDTDLIWLDAEEPLPFPAGSFGAVFVSDILDWVPAKDVVMSEINRVCSDDSMVLLSHLHNPDSNDPWKGSPLPASEWLRLMTKPYSSALIDEVTFDEFVRFGRLDLSTPCSEQAIAQADAYTVVAADHPDIFRLHEDVDLGLHVTWGRLSINPVYQTTQVANRLLLNKHWPSDAMRAENELVDRLLPDRLELEAGLVESLTAKVVPSEWQARVGELLREFVVVRVPECLR